MLNVRESGNVVETMQSERMKQEVIFFRFQDILPKKKCFSKNLYN